MDDLIERLKYAASGPSAHSNTIMVPVNTTVLRAAASALQAAAQREKVLREALEGLTSANDWYEEMMSAPSPPSSRERLVDAWKAVKAANRRAAQALSLQPEPVRND